MFSIDSITDQALIAEINAKGKVHHFKAGEVILQNETFIKSIPIVISGNIKVFRVGEENQELFLYYVGGGQACAVSLSSCLTSKQSKIKAVAEEDSVIVSIPINDAFNWFDTNRSWRTYVFQTLENRIEELLLAVDTMAFSKVDQRILSYLQAKAKTLKTNSLNITHQEIANELSTSREVVSRLLKKMEIDGLLELHRNRVVLMG
jgi:CRP/FNR family transcriptional regulator, anaerobic regulatory protein